LASLDALLKKVLNEGHKLTLKQAFMRAEDVEAYALEKKTPLQ